MMLYANGDSHTAGIGLIKSGETYASKVAKYYNLRLRNDATPGASNTKIIRTTKEFLDKNSTVGLILIGWSTWEREEWEYQGKFYNINSSGYDQLPEQLTEQYKHWVSAQTPELVNLKSNEWHKKIHNFHCELVDKKIPHLFFNCMYNFFNVSDDKKINWNLQYAYPYENDYSYYWYLTNQGYATDNWYHFDESGHQAWADFLIAYITENKLL
jgi:hypothetical protein